MKAFVAVSPDAHEEETIAGKYDQDDDSQMSRTTWNSSEASTSASRTWRERKFSSTRSVSSTSTRREGVDKMVQDFQKKRKEREENVRRLTDLNQKLSSENFKLRKQLLEGPGTSDVFDDETQTDGHFPDDATQITLSTFDGLTVDLTSDDNDRNIRLMERALKGKTQKMKLAVNALHSEIKDVAETMGNRVQNYMVELQQAEEQKLEKEDQISARDNILKMAQKEKESLLSHNKKLVSSVDDFKKHLDETIASLSVTEGRVEMLEKEKEKAERQKLDSLADKDRELERMRQMARAKESSLQSKIVALEVTKRKAVESLEVELQHARETADAKEMALKQLMEDVRPSLEKPAISEQLVDLQQKLNETEAGKERMEKEVDSLQQKLDDVGRHKDEQIEELNKKLSEHESSGSKSIVSLRNQLSLALIGKSQIAASLEVKMKEMEDRMQAKVHAAEESKATAVRSLTHQLDEAYHFNEQMDTRFQERMGDLERKRDEISTMLESLSNEVLAAKHDSEEAESQLSQKVRSMQKFFEVKLGVLENDIAYVTKQKEDLEEKLRRQGEAMGRVMNEAEADINLWRDRAKIEEELRQEFERELRIKTSSADALERALNDAKSEVLKEASTSKELRDKVTILESDLCSCRDDLERELINLSKLSELVAENNALHSSNEALAERNVSLKEDVNSTTECLIEANTEKERLVLMLEEAQDIIHDGESKLEVLAESEESLKKRIVLLDVRKDSEIEELRTSLKRSEQSNMVLRNEMQLQVKEVNDVKVQTRRAIEEVDQKLSDCKEELESTREENMDRAVRGARQEAELEYLRERVDALDSASHSIIRDCALLIADLELSERDALQELDTIVVERNSTVTALEHDLTTNVELCQKLQSQLKETTDKLNENERSSRDLLVASVKTLAQSMESQSAKMKIDLFEAKEGALQNEELVAQLNVEMEALSKGYTEGKAENKKLVKDLEAMKRKAKVAKDGKKQAEKLNVALRKSIEEVRTALGRHPKLRGVDFDGERKQTQASLRSVADQLAVYEVAKDDVMGKLDALLAAKESHDDEQASKKSQRKKRTTPKTATTSPNLQSEEKEKQAHAEKIVDHYKQFRMVLQEIKDSAAPVDLEQDHQEQAEEERDPPTTARQEQVTDTPSFISECPSTATMSIGMTSTIDTVSTSGFSTRRGRTIKVPNFSGAVSEYVETLDVRSKVEGKSFSQLRSPTSVLDINTKEEQAEEKRARRVVVEEDVNIIEMLAVSHSRSSDSSMLHGASIETGKGAKTPTATGAAREVGDNKSNGKRAPATAQDRPKSKAEKLAARGGGVYLNGLDLLNSNSSVSVHGGSESWDEESLCSSVANHDMVEGMLVDLENLCVSYGLLDKEDESLVDVDTIMSSDGSEGECVISPGGSLTTMK